MGFSSGENEVLDISFKVCSSLSLIGSIFIVLVYIGYRHLRSVFFLAVVCMQIGDAFNSSSYFLIDHGLYCHTQAFLNNFGALSSIIWSSLISRAIYNSQTSRNEQKFEFKKRYMVVGFVVPLLISSAPIFTNNYGYIGGYCWIEGRHDYLIKTLCLYLIVFCSITFNIRNYYIVIKEVRGQMGVLSNSSVMQREVKSISRRFQIYPLVIVVCYVPSMAKMIFEALLGPNIFLSLVCGCLECLMGFFNTFAYAFTPVVRSAVFNTLLCKRGEMDTSGSKFTLLLQEENMGFTFLEDISTSSIKN